MQLINYRIKISKSNIPVIFKIIEGVNKGATEYTGTRKIVK